MSSAVLAVLLVAGAAVRAADPPTFTLAWSEYPSWSVFGVAEDIGLLAKVQQKWNVKIKCEYMDYDKCMDAYTKKTVDATCMTNMDALVPALTRKAVAILPTSTSVGSDALLAVGVENIKELKDSKIPIYGLPASVSQYTFARIVELNGFKDSDFQFKEMDPDKAAVAMQTKDPN